MEPALKNSVAGKKIKISKAGSQGNWGANLIDAINNRMVAPKAAKIMNFSWTEKKSVADSINNLLLQVKYRSNPNSR